MARKARIKSTTGIYHVLVRAIADLPLFTDEEDTEYYTNILSDLQQQGRCEIYAYALFPTHVHLLIREGVQDSSSSKESSFSSSSSSSSQKQFSSSSTSSEPIGSIMKRLASTYSYFFNVKYDHYGPLYQDRFKSNPVETQDYYLRVLHHIANQDTPWKMATTTIPSGLPKEFSSSFSFSSSKESSSSLLEFRTREKRITDSKLLTYLQTNFQFTDIPEFLQREQEEQQEVIKAAKNVGGSIRQITRLTGSPYQYVFQVK